MDDDGRLLRAFVWYVFVHSKPRKYWLCVYYAYKMGKVPWVTIQSWAFCGGKLSTTTQPEVIPPKKVSIIDHVDGTDWFGRLVMAEFGFENYTGHRVAPDHSSEKSCCCEWLRRWAGKCQRQWHFDHILDAGVGYFLYRSTRLLKRTTDKGCSSGIWSEKKNYHHDESSGVHRLLLDVDGDPRI